MTLIDLRQPGAQMLFRKCAFTPISSSHCAHNVSGTFGSTTSPQTMNWFGLNLEDIQNGIFIGQILSHFLNIFLAATLFKQTYLFKQTHLFHSYAQNSVLICHSRKMTNSTFLSLVLPESVLVESVSDQTINNSPAHV